MRLATVPLALSLGLGLAFAAATALLATSEPGAFDAVAQYAAARLVASGRPSAVLDPDAVLAVEREAVPSRVTLLPFVQPPVTALVLAPLGTLPFGTAYAVMAALAAAAIVAALATAPRPRSLSPMIAATLLVAPPSVLAIAHAQTSAIVVLLVALSLRSLAWPGGIALGLTLLRPQTAPLLLLAGMADPRRRVGTLVGALVVVLGSAAVVGIDGLARYAGLLVSAAGWSITGDLGLRTSIGWSGLAVQLGSGEIGLAAAALSLTAGAWVVMRAPPSERIVLAAAWSLIASPHVLMHDAVLAYPALLLLAAKSAGWASLSIVWWLAHIVALPLAPLWSLSVAVAAGRRPSARLGALTGGRPATAP